MNTTSTCLERDVYSFSSDPFESIILISLVFGSLVPCVIWLMNVLNAAKTRINSIVPIDIKDPFYDKPMRIMGDNKVIHRIILIRHGESEHNKKYDGKIDEKVSNKLNMPTDLDLNTGLTSDGLKQATEVGKYLSSFNWTPDFVRISPMKRTKQTAEPFLKEFFGLNGDYTMFDHDICFNLLNSNECLTKIIMDENCVEVNIWKDQQLDSYGRVTKQETYEEFIQRIKKWKKQLETDALLYDEEDENIGNDNDNTGKTRIQTLVFTHSMVISEFLNLIVNENHANKNKNDWSKIYWQVNHGSITCLDFTNKGEWHIHAMNYSNYLKTHTATKSPFV
jgi:broad specificity phosphatase PhoE